MFVAFVAFVVVVVLVVVLVCRKWVTRATSVWLFRLTSEFAAFDIVVLLLNRSVATDQNLTVGIEDVWPPCWRRFEARLACLRSGFFAFSLYARTR